MRKIREVLRLKWELERSSRSISETCGIARSTVGEYLRRAEDAGLSWPLPEGLSDAQLESKLFPPPVTIPSDQRPLPDWDWVHRELARKSVTLFLLWQEYKERHPTGYQYSRFCELYRQWRGKLDVTLRQEHKAGEKLFVDYAGQTVPVVERSTGELREAQVFVAVLGASSYTFAEATWSQALPDWIGSHVRALEFLGGCPEILVPDNLRSAVSKAHRYEPDLNPTYQDFAQHYAVAVVPARARKPRDKAKAEAGVLLVERWILARLRNRTFFSLAELNQAIRELLTELNDRPFKKLPGSRRSLFEQLDRPALRMLPASRYEFAEWRKARVAPNCHVEVERHYYSAPYALAGHQLDVRLTAHTMELFHGGERVASHPRGHQPHGYTTVNAHMPAAHQAYLDWTPERLVQWAATSGSATATAIEQILASRPFPQQSFNACFGVMRLGKRYGDERLEAACRRALAIGSVSYKSLESILKQGLDRRPLPEPLPATQPVQHANLRGPGYYH
jgi:transposase